MQPVNVKRKGYGQPQAMQVPERVMTHDELDALHDFCFEWFGTDRGVYRLATATDDDPGPDAVNAMERHGTPLALWDRDNAQWFPVHGGDWIVEPKDEDGDGFIVLEPAEFEQRYEVIQ